MKTQSQKPCSVLDIAKYRHSLWAWQQGVYFAGLITSTLALLAVPRRWQSVQDNHLCL
jgi:hypothetical protein